MNRFLKKLVVSAIFLSSFVLVACTMMQVDGKSYEYSQVQIEYVGKHISNQTLIENEKQKIDATYENAVISFGADGKVELSGEISDLYYSQNGNDIKLYSDKQKSELYNNFDGEDVKLKIMGDNLKLTYVGKSDTELSDYEYTIIFALREGEQNENNIN